MEEQEEEHQDKNEIVVEDENKLGDKTTENEDKRDRNKVKNKDKVEDSEASSAEQWEH